MGDDLCGNLSVFVIYRCYYLCYTYIHTHEHTVLREVRTEAGQRDLHLRQAVFFVSAEAEETVEH